MHISDVPIRTDPDSIDRICISAYNKRDAGYLMDRLVDITFGVCYCPPHALD